MNVPSQGDMCVEVNKGQFRFSSAQGGCRSAGAELAYPRSEEDNQFLAELICYGENNLWLGVFDELSQLPWAKWTNTVTGNKPYGAMLLAAGDNYGEGADGDFKNGVWFETKSKEARQDVYERANFDKNNAYICMKPLQNWNIRIKRASNSRRLRW